MITMVEHRIAPLWRIAAGGFVLLGGIAWVIDIRDLIAIADLVLFSWLLVFVVSYRLIIEPDGFVITWSPAVLIPAPGKIRWADIVELRDWEFIAFEETWGVMVRAEDQKGKTRQVNIPGALANMPEILQAVLQHIPTTTVVDSHLRWRAQQLTKSKRTPGLQWLPRLGILMLVAICLGAGTLGFAWLESPVARWAALLASIALAGYLGSKIYQFR